MQKSERSAYTPIDFRQWRAAKSLLLSPKFQRRGVWNRAQRSFLIDTLLLELPVPPVFIRVVQSEDNKSVVREVIDGQQRLSAVLDFMEDNFSLANNIESAHAGKRFSELPPEDQNKIARYSFICEVFYGVSDKDVLRVFARLNTHSVKLNDQELRNGQYFGDFKQSCYNLAFEHLEFWRKNGIFTEQNIARMQEAELASELLIMQIDGIQDKKKSIHTFYEKFDETYPGRNDYERKFRATIDAINEAIPDGLGTTEFRRVPLFYSLFTAVHHRLFRTPRLTSASPATGRMTRDDLEGVSNAVSTLSEIVSNAKAGNQVSEFRLAFVNACLRQTDNIRPRQTRTESIYTESFG